MTGEFEKGFMIEVNFELVTQGKDLEEMVRIEYDLYKI